MLPAVTGPQLLLLPPVVAAASVVFVLCKEATTRFVLPKQVSNGKASSTHASEVVDGSREGSYSVQGNILDLDGAAIFSSRLLRLLGVLALLSTQIFQFILGYSSVVQLNAGYFVLVYYVSDISSFELVQ